MKKFLYLLALSLSLSFLVAFNPNEDFAREKVKECPPEGREKKGRPTLSAEKKEFNKKKEQVVSRAGHGAGQLFDQ